jgi:hypothetical protein
VLSKKSERLVVVFLGVSEVVGVFVVDTDMADDSRGLER